MNPAQAALAPSADNWYGLPPDLAAALNALATLSPPAGFPADRWPDALASALEFAECWAGRALVLGWTPLELFGLHPVAPAARYDAIGLAWSLERGARVVALNDTAATILMPSGSILRYARPPYPGESVLPWRQGYDAALRLRRRNTSVVS